MFDPVWVGVGPCNHFRPASVSHGVCDFCEIRMKTETFIPSAKVVLLLGGLLLSPWLFAADEPEPVPPSNRPDRAALRERAKRLSPEEQQKRLREFRERNGFPGTNRMEWEKRREALKQLPPAERAAKLKELRQEIQQNRGKYSQLSAEERDIKRRELRERIDAQVAEMRRRKAEGSLNESELRRLQRMEQMAKRLARSPQDRQAPKPQRRPGADGDEVLPPPSPK